MSKLITCWSGLRCNCNLLSRAKFRGFWSAFWDGRTYATLSGMSHAIPSTWDRKAWCWAFGGLPAGRHWCCGTLWKPRGSVDVDCLFWWSVRGLYLLFTGSWTDGTDLIPVKTTRSDVSFLTVSFQILCSHSSVLSNNFVANAFFVPWSVFFQPRTNRSSKASHKLEGCLEASLAFHEAYNRLQRFCKIRVGFTHLFQPFSSAKMSKTSCWLKLSVFQYKQGRSSAERKSQ